MDLLRDAPVHGSARQDRSGPRQAGWPDRAASRMRVAELAIRLRCRDCRHPTARIDPVTRLPKQAFVALLHESSLARTMPTDRILTCRADGADLGPSAWPYDTWVPLVIRSAGLGAARVEQSVRSVDMAPTLAALAAITVPEGLDGVDLIGRVGQ